MPFDRRSGLLAWADSTSGCAECMVAEEHVLDDEAFLQEVLDPLILFFLPRSDRTPIHASGFVAGGLAVLLAGPSGMGKSCLALAVHEAGFSFLSDDTCMSSCCPNCVSGGVPRPIHLFSEDAPSGSGNAVRVRDGKLKYAVFRGYHDPKSSAARTESRIRGVPPTDRPAEAMRILSKLDRGFDLLRDDIETVLGAVTRSGAWRLTLSANPAHAMGLLRENLSRLDSVIAS